MTIAIIISIIIIATYIGAVIVKEKEIPESISSIVFHLPKKWEWAFTIVLWLVGFSIVPMLMEKSADNTRVLAFFMVAGILGVGSSPLVAKERNTFHKVCAVVAGVTSQCLVALNQPLLLLTWSLYVGYTLVAKDVSKNFFWVEVSCMLPVFAYCLM